MSQWTNVGGCNIKASHNMYGTGNISAPFFQLKNAAKSSGAAALGGQFFRALRKNKVIPSTVPI